MSDGMEEYLRAELEPYRMCTTDLAKACAGELRPVAAREG